MSDHEYDYYYSEPSEDESDTEEQTIKYSEQINYYPLKHTWVLYEHIKSSSETYESSTRKICDFNTVIKFWQIFNNYPNPSKLFNDGITKKIIKSGHEIRNISSLSVFKNGILPKWEDEINKHGAELSKRNFNKENPLEELDNNWFDLLIACVGSMIDSGVTGVRVVDSSTFKKNESNTAFEFKLAYRIELWFDKTTKEQSIRNYFKNILSIEDDKNIVYKEHKC